MRVMPLPCREITAQHGTGMSTLTGPWERAFYAELPTALHSKSNHRHGAKSGWATLRNFEIITGMTLANSLPEGWDLGDPTDPVAARPAVVMVILAQSMLDTSNFSKSVADAAEGVVVHNDASITATSSLGIRAQKNPRAAVAFAQLPAGSSLTERSRALTELTDQAAALFEA